LGSSLRAEGEVWTGARIEAGRVAGSRRAQGWGRRRLGREPLSALRELLLGSVLLLLRRELLLLRRELLLPGSVLLLRAVLLGELLLLLGVGRLLLVVLLGGEVLMGRLILRQLLLRITRELLLRLGGVLLLLRGRHVGELRDLEEGQLSLLLTLLVLLLLILLLRRLVLAVLLLRLLRLVLLRGSAVLLAGGHLLLVLSRLWLPVLRLRLRVLRLRLRILRLRERLRLRRQRRQRPGRLRQNGRVHLEAVLPGRVLHHNRLPVLVDVLVLALHLAVLAFLLHAGSAIFRREAEVVLAGDVGRAALVEDGHIAGDRGWRGGGGSLGLHQDGADRADESQLREAGGGDLRSGR